MNTTCSALVRIYLFGDIATRPLAHLVGRLPLSRLVTGPGLLPRCFAEITRPNTPSGASNYGF